jgi:transmembrane sensor
MSAARDSLAKYVPPRLTGARVARQWEAIEARADASRRRWRIALPVGFAFAGAVAAFAVVILVRRAPPAATAATLVDGTWLESPASGPAPAVTLADGSRVVLGAKSRLRVTSTRPDAVRLDLERGRVDVKATHVEGRSFLVKAGDVEVYVVGTRFTVEEDGAVRVHVDEGRVRVHDSSGDRFVAGGEEWAQDAAPEGDRPAASADVDDVPTEPRANEGAGASSAPSAVTRAGAPDARALLDDAQRALAQGRPSDAARSFDAIRRDHRHDARAGLAAFELGRLRLDALGDPNGAAEAFRDAIRLAREPGLRDDAAARRVEALERMGAGAEKACIRARDSYLASHASGVHRSEVAGRCGGQ